MTTRTQSQGSGRRRFWRSLQEHADPGSVESLGSDVVRGIVSRDELLQLDRRRFLTLSGAIGALAGVEGCIRRPVEKIMPYTDMPEGVNPGIANHYATTVARRGESLGLLMTSHEGRPTKVEGNGDSPSSLGATDLWAQASILDLYDADRARAPSRGAVPQAFADVDAFLAGRVEALAKAGGQGLRVLAQPTDSPTFLGLRERVLARFPQAGFHTYAPITDANGNAGARLAFGEPLQPDPRFESAKVILSLDSDFLMTETGSVVAARRFASGRRLESSGGEMSRLYVVEPVLSVTGANADHRLPLAGRAVGRYAAALAAELVKSHNLDLGVVGTSVANAANVSRSGIPDAWITTVARDLVEHRGACLLVAGARQPAAVHALVHALNRALGASGRTVAYLPVHDAGARDPFEDIRTLATDMAAGRVDTLIILGGNPVYDAPADAGFAGALAKVSNSVHFGAYFDETSEHCAWHVPRAHELETWGDHLGRWGYYAVQQPLIAPLWGGRSDIEVLGQLAGESNWRGHALVRATAQSRGVAGDDAAWNALLQLGVYPGEGSPVSGGSMLRDADIAAALSSLLEGAGAAGLEAVFVADNKLLDGGSANNAWLLEMPDPITRIVWDNAALIAPSTARELGVDSGDIVALTLGGASVDIAVWVQPGQAPGSVGLPLGWGRRRAGNHGNGKGFDVYPLRTSSAPHFASGLKLERRGTTYRFSQTQEYDRMEERPIAIERTVAEYAKEPNFGQMDSPDPSVGPLWKTVDYTKGLQWGMTIDLNSCVGCNACVLACQSENNIPTVGKIQVGRGREMHWLRIDRYYAGEDVDNPAVAFQPVACQQCEEAPCENVCPVSATSHSPEGLNDMAYNRCIGTRYCANNCPYKVRRFNFFNYNLEIPESQKMQYNPSVSIRFRGVMEKCTYCVQRIESAKIAARREDRGVRDGDIRTACQQACPAQAIVFGDINDPESAVSKARLTDRNYALLAEIGTRPRTRYLGKVRNPNSEMPS